MAFSRFMGSPGKLLALFVVLAGVPVACLGWLGWRLIEQDRALEEQRVREHLENAASILGRELDHTLASWEELLAAGVANLPGAVPTGAVLLVFDHEGISRQRGVQLPYYPVVASGPKVDLSVFASSERLEFRDGNPAQAAIFYRELSSANNPPLRAAALMRLARCLRHQQQFANALAVYRELEAMGDVPAGGTPSGLLARHERIALLEIIGNHDVAKHEAALLHAALWQGRYRLDRATFEFYSRELPLEPNPTLALAEAAEGSWPLWHQQSAGRSSWSSGTESFVTVWRAIPAGTAAMAGSLENLMRPVKTVMRDLQVRVTLDDPAGRLLWGTRITDRGAISKTYRQAGLPWTLGVAAADPAAARRAWVSRRTLLTGGFGLMVLVITAASYFVFRSVNRELAVARLQSEFVGAVSHEFRTPLTAVRHLAEILEDGRASSDRLQHYYRAIGNEAGRLQRIVENLLDFGTIEAGKRTYHLEETNAAALVRRVVAEFQEHCLNANPLKFHAVSDELLVYVDPEAIELALRNLLDNAIKYSPASSPVRVCVASRRGLTSISVQDQGPGIPREEQREIFRKFVRGASAKTLNVKGTGIGLAMADHIVRAHGGSLELESQASYGSRFTILLPSQSPHP